MQVKQVMKVMKVIKVAQYKQLLQAMQCMQIIMQVTQVMQHMHIVQVYAGRLGHAGWMREHCPRKYLKIVEISGLCTIIYSNCGIKLYKTSASTQLILRLTLSRNVARTTARNLCLSQSHWQKNETPTTPGHHYTTTLRHARLLT